MILVWKASDRICGKRLKAALPHLVESKERHGHLDLDPEVRARLLTASAATLDRLLKPVRATVAGRSKRRRRLSTGRNIPVRTQTIHYGADWNRPPLGILEIDLVAHCGESMGGSFVYSLIASDVYAGWTEAVSLQAREQPLVVTGLEPSNHYTLTLNTVTHPVLRRPGHRVHPFPSLPEEQPGLGRAEEWGRDPTVSGPRALLGPGGGTDHSPPARCDAMVRELLPAIVQAGGENPQWVGRDQPPQPASHTLRPGAEPRDGQRRSESDTR